MPELDQRPNRSSELLLHPTFVKLLVSTVFGGGVWVLTKIFEGDSLSTPAGWSILISLFAASVAFVVQHLITVEKLNEATRDELREGLLRINEANKLFDLVEKSAIKVDLITQFVRNATKVDQRMPSLIQNFAQTEIERMATLLRELEEGDVTYEGEDRDWLLSLAKNTETTIDALSLNLVDQGPTEVDGGFWITDAGQRYLDIQRERIKHGVRIRRIFYVDDEAQLGSKMFQQIIQMHATSGIGVRILTQAQLESPLGVDDFIIFDGVVSYEIMASVASQVGGLTTHTFVRTLLILERPRVAHRIERFRELWALAREPAT
jgi:hypothetical protein